ncbi:MAG: type I-U CRISPR-associated protein Cas5/Cas6, partial [Dehalococcoidia bacterium]|nr:type I-U CRISPR-associated protein Cas5/Cas6 [Dehalococcoidia bacterium]
VGEERLHGQLSAGLRLRLPVAQAAAAGAEERGEEEALGARAELLARLLPALDDLERAYAATQDLGVQFLGKLACSLLIGGEKELDDVLRTIHATRSVDARTDAEADLLRRGFAAGGNPSHTEQLPQAGIAGSVQTRQTELYNRPILTRQRHDIDDEPVRLLAPLSPTEYDQWLRGHRNAPRDLLGALQMDTTEIETGNWSLPPGSREVVYWRPVDALLPYSQVRRSADIDEEVVSANAALFALSTDWQRDVLPLIERALPTMALFRRALLSKLREGEIAACPELTGKDEHGRPLRSGHRLAHYLPLSLNPRNRGRIDHVLVYAPMGFGRAAEGALRRMRKTWAKGIDDIAVTLVGLGDISSFRNVGGAPILELGESTIWESRTPFIPPRFLKPRGKDSLEGQVRAELRHRGLPDIAASPSVTLPTAQNKAGLEARWFRHFIRTRKDNKAPEPPQGLFHLTLTFQEAVRGPLCLGWGCHFGLGLFIPAIPSDS